MTKKELIEKIRIKFPGNQYNEKIIEIEEKLVCFPENYPFATLNSIKTYIDSMMSPQFTSSDKILEEIDYDIAKVIKNRAREKERDTKNALNNSRHIGMWIFLSVILLFTAVGIVCIIIGFVIDGESDAGKVFDKIGAAFGFGDFALGAVGFVWERISDIKNESKKEELHEKFKAVNDAKYSRELVDATNEFVKTVNLKNSNNNVIAKGRGAIAFVGDNNSIGSLFE